MARLPNPPKLKDQVLEEYLVKLVQAIEQELRHLGNKAMTKDRIKVTNNTLTYAFDASADTLGTTRFVLATLLEQLQRTGDLA